jgi:hypothetical protein
LWRWPCSLWVCLCSLIALSMLSHISLTALPLSALSLCSLSALSVLMCSLTTAPLTNDCVCELGHTHEDIDQFFSIPSKYMKHLPSQIVRSIKEFFHHVKASFKSDQDLKMRYVHTVHDFKKMQTQSASYNHTITGKCWSWCVGALHCSLVLCVVVSMAA